MLSTLTASITRLRPLFSILAGVLTVLLLALLLCRPINDYDIWWHLFFGGDILRNLAIPAVDRYALLNLGRPLHDSHWLFQVLLATAYRLGGIAGTELVRIGLCSGFLACCYVMSRRSASAVLSCLLLLIAACASEERFLPRPELISLLMITLFAWRLQAGAYRRWSDLVLLAGLQVLWVNAHGLFVIGPFLVGCYLLAALVQRLRGGDRDAPRSLALALGAVSAACLVNPYGWGSLRYAWLLFTEAGGGASLAIKSVGEMAPTFGEAARNQSASWFFLLLVCVWGASWCAAMLDRHREVSLARTLIGVGLLAAALTARRNIPLFALVAAPLVAEHLAICGRRSWRVACALFSAVVLLVAAVAWNPRSALQYLHELPGRVGVGVSPAYFPLGLPATLAQLHFSGPIFNSGSLGGFYLFHGYPARIPFYDGRMEAYQPAALESVQRTIHAASANPALWEDFARRFGFAGVLLQHLSPEAESLLQILPRDGSWQLVYLDGAASFWVRRDLPGMVPATPLAQLLAPAAAAADWEQAVLLDWFLQRIDAEPSLRLPLLLRVGQQNPRPELLAALGTLQVKTGQLAAGAATLDRLLAVQPHHREGLRARALAAFLTGDAAVAERLLQRAVALYPDDQGLRGDLERIRVGQR
jgi:hypothetical protein